MKMVLDVLPANRYFEKGTNPLLTPIKDDLDAGTIDDSSMLFRMLWDLDFLKLPSPEEKNSDQLEEGDNKKEGNSLLSMFNFKTPTF